MKAQLDTGCYVFSTNSTYVSMYFECQHTKYENGFKCWILTHLNNGSSLPVLMQSASSFEIH